MTGTPSQTVGPFFARALAWLADAAPAGGHMLSGRVLDGDGEPVPDAVVECSGPAGAFRRALTDADGRWSCALEPVQHYDVSVFARGLLQRLCTRVYLPGAADDEVLLAVPAERRRTMRATAPEGGLVWDIRLQGDDETVFLVW